jgi:hypothetical protein
MPVIRITNSKDYLPPIIRVTLPKLKTKTKKINK